MAIYQVWLEPEAEVVNREYRFNVIEIDATFDQLTRMIRDDELITGIQLRTRKIDRSTVEITERRPIGFPGRMVTRFQPNTMIFVESAA